MKAFYRIDYGTGVTHDYDAMDEALEFTDFTYTGESVKIYSLDTEGEVIELEAISKWYGVPAEEDDEVIADFHKYGFYDIWRNRDGKQYKRSRKNENKI